MFFPYRDENNARSLPLFTIGLILLNVAFFYLTAIRQPLSSVIQEYGFTSASLLQRPVVVISSLFLHANLLHLISNMWFLWLFGDNIEDRFGKLSFLTMYIMAGIAGNFTHALFSGFESNIPVIGASGAVAGVMGSYLVRFPFARIRCVFLLIFYPIFFRIHAFWFIGFWMIFEFISAGSANSGNIAHWAHIGGLIFGLAWTIGRRDKRR